MSKNQRSATSRRLQILIVSLGLLLGLATLTPPAASAADWREYTSGGRQWREKCDTYSSTVTRCRVEIWATNAVWDGRRFSVKDRWTFNNLLYKPSARAQWAGNPLAQNGEWTVNGRRWRTECDTDWTGSNGCRSSILAYVPHYNGKRYVNRTKWVFNNTVQFTGGSGTIPPLTRDPNTVITDTTARELGVTYKKGCPVGPRDLSTIRINQIDMDGRVHRGEIIVRRNLARKVADSFEQILAAGFPVEQMRNPTVWGGVDEDMMYANNTSGFNCRRVVGNPTALSPHSYGRAVDVNPVQNPYRDPTGRWWPSRRYSTNRDASVPGLHTANSASVKALKGNGFRWFSGWDWHHFEYPRSGAARSVDPLSAAPVTAGGLDDGSLVVPQGWDGAIKDGSPEEGFTGNDSWLHAVDPATKGTDVLAIGCAVTTTDAPEPVAALEGNLVADGQSGISVAMQFASETEAEQYFASWQSQKRACVGTTVSELGASSGTWLGQWDVDGSLWSEAGGQRGDTVKLTLLDADLAVDKLQAISDEF